MNFPALEECSQSLVDSCLDLVAEDLNIEKYLDWLNQSRKISVLKWFLEFRYSTIQEIFFDCLNEINLSFYVRDLKNLAALTKIESFEGDW